MQLKYQIHPEGYLLYRARQDLFIRSEDETSGAFWEPACSLKISRFLCNESIKSIRQGIDQIEYIETYLRSLIGKLESDYRPIETGYHTRIEIEGSTETVFKC